MPMIDFEDPLRRMCADQLACNSNGIESNLHNFVIDTVRCDDVQEKLNSVAFVRLSGQKQFLRNRFIDEQFLDERLGATTMSYFTRCHISTRFSDSKWMVQICFTAMSNKY